MNEVGLTDLPFATLFGNSQMDAITRMSSRFRIHQLIQTNIFYVTQTSTTEVYTSMVKIPRRQLPLLHIRI